MEAQRGNTKPRVGGSKKASWRKRLLK